MEECEHGGDPMACGPCLRERDPATAAATRPRIEHGRPFAAKYEGWCFGCGGPVEVGDTIVYRWVVGEEDDSRIVHAGCAKR